MKKKQEVLVPHGGLQAAIDLVKALSPQEQKKILSSMKQQNAYASNLIEDALVTFHDIIHITPVMLQKLLKEVKDFDLHLCLRNSSDDLKTYVLQNLSKARAEEIKGLLLGPPQKLSNIEAAQNNLIALVREKIKKGEIFLSKSSSKNLV